MHFQVWAAAICLICTNADLLSAWQIYSEGTPSDFTDKLWEHFLKTGHVKLSQSISKWITTKKVSF